MKKTILISLLFTAFISVKAARPTKHANFSQISASTCNALNLTWSAGNGNGRIIVAKEGSAPTWTPSDNVSYSANSAFGKGTDLGNDQYIVANSMYTSDYNFQVSNLNPNQTYYFIIYEHDNAGANTLYYITGSPAQINGKTANIDLNFNIKFIDSCEQHNAFQFTRLSTASLSGISYQWDFGDGNFSTDSFVKYSYKNKSGKLDVKLSASGSVNCTITKAVRVYPKVVAYIDFSKFDSTQCLQGNYFEIDPQPLISSLPKSFTYNWDFGDSSQISPFKKMKHTYSRTGRFNIALEIVTNVNLNRTGCKDILRFTLNVSQASSRISGSDYIQCLNNNLFNYKNDDSSSVTYSWDFGDGNNLGTRNSQHSYATAGEYKVIHLATDNYSCTTKDSFKVTVIPALNTGFHLTDFCQSNNKIKLIPAFFKGGVFSGYPVNGTILIPNAPGSYTLKYVAKLSNCSDSTSKNFKIKPSPAPRLGNDTLIFSSQQLTLDGGIAFQYLWNTGDTSRRLKIDTSTALRGTTNYSVISTDSNGCNGYDTIAVSIDFKSLLQNPRLGTFKVYPNPITDFLNIINTEGLEFKWIIYNATGKLIKTGDKSTSMINMSEMPKGVYMLSITSKEKTGTIKLIKL